MPPEANYFWNNLRTVSPPLTRKLAGKYAEQVLRADRANRDAWIAKRDAEKSKWIAENATEDKS